MKYWSNKGKHQAAYDRLYKELVPDEGEAQTEFGNVLRSMSNVYYDLYNNSGCNLEDARRTQYFALMDALSLYGYPEDKIAAFKRGIRWMLKDEYDEHKKECDGAFDGVCDFLISHIDKALGKETREQTAKAKKRKAVK